MKIYTARDNPIDSSFERIKRKKKAGWRFLFSGEWSQSATNQGKTTFFYSHTSDRRYWALLERGFPNRIVSVAETDPASSDESILGAMLRAVRLSRGSCIEALDQFTKSGIDVNEILDITWSDGDVM